MAKTMAQKIAEATSKVSGEITNLGCQREAALSSFRSTAAQLGNINEVLADRINQLTELADFINSESAAASKMMVDNEHVRAKIFEILGE